MARNKGEGIDEVVEMAPEETDDMADLLKQAAQQLSQAASDKEHRSARLKEVEATLSKIKLVDFPELADSPVVQAFIKAMGFDDLTPGEARNKGTLAEREREWTWKDMAQLPKVKFIPNETIVLTFNGLPLQVVADQECEVPEPFYNIWKDHRKAIMEARQHTQYLLGFSDQPPDPNWLTVEGAEVRAWSTQGRRLGKVSGHLGVGRISEAEEATLEEGENAQS
ncbi:MAG: hypothetical protein M0R06_25295 [Sphaerochaeta sp.]|jgi:hypothetical protein|nr:hypothetical protein [Sphaerochaeta sp.]